jgi:hypothetical protein
MTGSGTWQRSVEPPQRVERRGSEAHEGESGIGATLPSATLPGKDRKPPDSAAPGCRRGVGLGA